MIYNNDDYPQFRFTNTNPSRMFVLSSSNDFITHIPTPSKKATKQITTAEIY